MSNALAIFDNKANMPGYLNDFFEEEGGNIVERGSVPSLGIEGKVWTVALNGEKTKLIRTNEDGDEVPVPVIRGVILAYSPERARNYYEGGYDPATPTPPKCWSNDGVKPDASIAEPVHSVCAKCPMSIKGSRVNEQGKEVIACAQHRMLAVLPMFKKGVLNDQALRLKLSITSLFDGQSPDLEKEGWFAFENLLKFLRSKGVKHTAGIIVKMKFDPNVAYPKVIFSPEAMMPQDLLTAVKPMLKDEAVLGLIEGKWTPAGTDGKPVDEPAEPAEDKAAKAAEEAKAKAEAAKKAKAEAAAKKKAEEEAKAKAEAEAAEAAKKAAALAEDEDEDGDIDVDLTPAKPAQTTREKLTEKQLAGTKGTKAAAEKEAKAETKAEPAGKPDVGALLDEWD